MLPITRLRGHIAATSRLRMRSRSSTGHVDGLDDNRKHLIETSGRRIEPCCSAARALQAAASACGFARVIGVNQVSERAPRTTA
jgi:hypothetical protein